MDLHEVRDLLVTMKEGGSLRDQLARIPGLAIRWSDHDLDREPARILAMLDSMTPLERSYPFLASIPGRCERIARGAGVEPAEVSSLLRQWRSMNDLLAGQDTSDTMSLVATGGRIFRPPGSEPVSSESLMASASSSSSRRLDRC